MSSLVTYPFYLFIYCLFMWEKILLFLPDCPVSRPPDYTCFFLLSAGVTNTCCPAGFHMSAGDLNSGPPVCSASMLPSPVTWKDTFTFMKHKVGKPNFMGVKDHVVLINETFWGERNRDAERLETCYQRSELGQGFLDSQHLTQEWNRSPHRLQSMRKLHFKQNSSD